MMKIAWHASGIWKTNKPWFHRAFWLQGKFIDGCTSHKAESITYHKNSASHKLASQCHKAKQNPEKTPAYLARQQLLKQFNRKLRLFFRNQPSCRTVHSNKTRPEVARNSMQRNACILRVECFVWNKVLAGNKNVLVKRQLYWCSNHSKSNAEESLLEDSTISLFKQLFKHVTAR